MRPKKQETTGSGDLFRARLDQIINTKHELVQTASPMHTRCGRSRPVAPGGKAIFPRREVMLIRLATSGGDKRAAVGRVQAAVLTRGRPERRTSGDALC
jgi:IS5 family transposase